MSSHPPAPGMSAGTNGLVPEPLAGYQASLRLLLYFITAFPVLVFVSGSLMTLWSPLESAVVAVLASSIAANSLAMLIFERRSLLELGLRFEPAAVANFVWGFISGAGAALIVLGVPLVAGWAELEEAGQSGFNLSDAARLALLLLVGAFGEEFFFHGYGFQRLIPQIGVLPAVVLTSGLFTWAHSMNPNVTLLGLTNTFLWAAVIGYACWRTRGLYAAVGLHYGWNVLVAFSGTQLSGFDFETGYRFSWKIGDLWSGGNYGPEGGLFTTLILCPVLLFVLKGPYKAQQYYWSSPEGRRSQ